MSQFGFSLLAMQIADHLASEWEWMSEEKQMVGDTKIEQLFFAALTKRCEIAAVEYSDLLLVYDQEHLTKSQNEAHNAMLPRLIAWPQAQIDNRRVDFLFSSYHYSESKWRYLLVECDGHDFHERTKEQASRDKSKDRTAVLAGYDCFRFTGSEIWRDPWGCAKQVTDWSAKGLG